MTKIEVGAAYRFTPSAFSGEKSGMMGGKEVPREVCGTIVSVNRAHRMFVVKAMIHDRVTLHECFKF